MTRSSRKSRQNSKVLPHADTPGLPESMGINAGPGGAACALPNPVSFEPAKSALLGTGGSGGQNAPGVDHPELLRTPYTETPVSILSQITHPHDVSKLSLVELEALASELRARMIQTVSCTGGHLAPSLGVVELTLAMLSVFNPSKDKVVWDVGHQAYAYKLLTGRADKFHTLRQLDGICGFPTPQESEFDHFGVGHSSTSVSAALGMAKARDLAGEDHHVVSVIGDGSLTAGLAYEGLNQAGATAKRFIVILNDNEMSIAKNVGALSLFMSRNLSSRWVRRIKREVETFLGGVPGIGDDLLEIARRSKHSFKNFFTPGILFEALRFNYIGAVDGHNLEELLKHFRLAASLDRPVLIHVLTRKGKGYFPAEQNPVLFHGVGAFEPETGCQSSAQSPCPAGTVTFTQAFGQGLCKLAEKDKRVLAITAAMPEGTGLMEFSERFPDRFVDVGICEQHAVTFAAGLAIQGFRPFVAIYSTFLQRAYDQIIHDVCLQNLPVTFCVDRAGIVGEDGPTHQGAFDIAYLRTIPNITLFSPKDGVELQQGLLTALDHGAPFALRYPRGAAPEAEMPEKLTPLIPGEAEYVRKGDGSLAVIALGSCVAPTLRAAELLAGEQGPSATVLNARWIKPLPERELREIIAAHKHILIVEEGAQAGGFGSAVIEFWSDNALLAGQRVRRLGLPDRFVEHGPAGEIRKRLDLAPEGVLQAIRDLIA